MTKIKFERNKKMEIRPINQGKVENVTPPTRDPKPVPVEPTETEKVKKKDDAVIVELSEEGKALAADAKKAEEDEKEAVTPTYGPDATQKG